MTRRKFTREFKIQALELARQLGSVAEAAKQLGVRDTVIHNWKRKFNFSIDETGRKPVEAVSEAEEIKRLRRENDELKKVNYILKKAAAFFSQDHLK
jgi:transposase